MCLRRWHFIFARTHGLLFFFSMCCFSPVPPKQPFLIGCFNWMIPNLYMISSHLHLVRTWIMGLSRYWPHARGFEDAWCPQGLEGCVGHHIESLDFTELLLKSLGVSHGKSASSLFECLEFMLCSSTASSTCTYLFNQLLHTFIQSEDTTWHHNIPFYRA